MQNAATARRVSILIPNYKTPELTKVCLRLIRKNTDPEYAEVIVIDNNSADASLDYLRSLAWIRLLERDAPDKSARLAHSTALDLALAQVQTPYVLSIHTDTLVRHPQWLQFLVAEIEKDENIAGVGSWKLERKSKPKKIAKSLEYAWQSFYYRLIGKRDHSLEGIGDNYYYLRSHCALYRTALLKKYGLQFTDGDETAGKVMHRKLLERGHEMVFLPDAQLLRYLEHAGHASSILNPQFRARKNRRRGARRVRNTLKRFDADGILADASLDE